jgi:LacI family transcriptional regulator
MIRRRITARDVAARAGVSRTTVSFVLNGVTKVNISEETRERVRAAAVELGYVPDAAAQALASGRAQTIGLVFSQSPLYSTSATAHMQIIEGLMDVARQSGVRLLIDSVGHADSVETYVKLTRTKRIDGLILLNARVDDHALHDLVNDDFPIILLGYLPHIKACSLDFDNRGGARTAVEHLLAQGHRRIGLITYAPITFTGAAERLQGYQDALAAAGIPFDESLVWHGNFEASSGFNAANSLLAMPDPPTAVFAASDIIAFGALAAIHQRGLAIPNDIAVVGFDDHPLAQFTIPPLTTMHISFEDMGRRAGLMLLDRIQNKVEAGRQVRLDAALVVRASSCKT